MKELFGTDGIRGAAGAFPLDDTTVETIGASLARQMRERLGRSPRFICGRDTRESGASIEFAFATGAVGAGAEVSSAGVITTPGVAYLTRALDLDAGVVISASHNPYEDNGIKIFSPSGKKIDEGTERAIERDVYEAEPSSASTKPWLPDLSSDRAREFCSMYVQHLEREANGFSAAGRKLMIDCANGAASNLAPELFARTGAELVVINNSPDGRNINEGCGSLHLDQLQARLKAEGANMGIAFDGDADRALFVDENGEVVDGDGVLWVMARYLRDHGSLYGGLVVSTVMSNIGLEIALSTQSIKLIRTNVGDKYVLDKLLETGGSIGGEQSGHIIFPEISLVGDGMMTAMLLLRTICERGQTLGEAVKGFVRYPQILLNVKVREKRPFDEVPEIARASDELRTDLDGNGRLLLRYSGTENLARVMIEGEDQSTIERQARELAGVIERNLG